MTAPWMPPLPEPPAFYRYQFSSFYGDVWRSDHREWNGHTPKATEGLYTADQMRARDAEVARAALEQAARWVRNRADAYDAEHGTTDPETGAREYPGTGDEYMMELAEIEDGIRALAKEIA